MIEDAPIQLQENFIDCPLRLGEVLNHLMQEFDKLLQIMHRLRNECPWDKEQDLKSLRKYLLEEAYECVTAMDQIETHGQEALIEELGDVLLQVVFQAEVLGEPTHRSLIEDILKSLNDKLVRRHPHIFDKAEVKTAEEVHRRWEEIKKSEKPASDNPLESVAHSLTALQRAQKFGDKAKKMRFDWLKPQDVWLQFESEVKELEEAKTPAEKEHEIGDLFFCLVQYARHLGIDSETALHLANQRFEARFKTMHEIAKDEKRSFDSYTLDEKEILWARAKEKLKNS